MSLNRPYQVYLFFSIAPLVYCSCFDRPASSPICVDRRIHLQEKAGNIKRIISNQEDNPEASDPLVTKDEKIDAILRYEQKLFEELTEDRMLSCGRIADFSGQCREWYPILFNSALTGIDPSYYRAPWLYLVGERKLTDSVIVCDLILDENYACLNSEECSTDERCIAFSTSIPDDERMILDQALPDHLDKVISRYCGSESDGCTRCITTCTSEADCTLDTESCVVPGQASHGICLTKSNTLKGM